MKKFLKTVFAVLIITGLSNNSKAGVTLNYDLQTFTAGLNNLTGTLLLVSHGVDTLFNSNGGWANGTSSFLLGDDTYFFNNTTGIQDWVSTSATSTKAGDTAILPGTYIIHRNSGGTPVGLSLTVAGGVFSAPFSNYLATSSSSQTDNYLALPRPTDYSLNELGLDNSSFTQSTSTSPGGRRDTLLVVNVNGSGANRAAAATYFRFNNNWYSTAASTVITNTAVIPAGSAVIIRKVISDGNDRVWTNNLNVSL